MIACFATFLLFFLSPAARATVPGQFGMGADHIGMANAGTTLAADPSAAWYNPAGIGQARFVVLEAGWVFGQAELWDFHDIVYDANGDGRLQDEDGYPDHGDVGTDYRVLEGRERAPFYTSGIQVGASFPIWRRVSIGLAAYMPTASLMRIEIQDPTLPYYVMWKNRNNRFTLNPALSVQPVRGLYLGVGAQLMTDMVARGRVSSWVEVEAFPSTPRADGAEISAKVKGNLDQLVLSLKPRTALNLGFLLDLGAFARALDPKHADRYDTLDRFALGAAWRGEWFVSTDADILVSNNGHIRVDDEDILLSSLLEKPVEIQVQDMVGFYDPPQFSAGMRHGYGPLTIAADLSWCRWSRFTDMTSPSLRLDIESLAGTSVTVESGADLGPPAFKDTLSFRTGGYFEFGPYASVDRLQALSFFLRGGFGFVPTPVPEQTGLSSYMDSDRSVYAAGLGVQAGRVRGFSRGPIRLDVGGQLQVLEPRTTFKDRSLLTDADGDGIVDWPRGWPLSGSLTSGGAVWVVSVGVEMKFAPPGAQTETQPRPPPSETPAGGPT